MYYKINVSTRKEHKPLFEELLPYSADLLCSLKACLLPSMVLHLKDKEVLEFQKFIKLMEQVRKVAQSHEIDGIKVANSDKIFSIFEPDTDIIVKGSRDISFGHKVLLASGKSNLILDVAIPRGNPKDSSLAVDEIKRIQAAYDITPTSVAFDGGFASTKNVTELTDLSIKNIVFNKTVGSLQNVAENSTIERNLKKWRAGMEAVISNVKRGFNLESCTWKGWEHFQAKVYWSVLGYNIRTMTRNILRHFRNHYVTQQ